VAVLPWLEVAAARLAPVGRGIGAPGLGWGSGMAATLVVAAFPLRPKGGNFALF
jgi:hypothetical protein